MTSTTKTNLTVDRGDEQQPVFVSTRFDAPHLVASPSAESDPLHVPPPPVEVGTDLDELAQLVLGSADEQQDQIRLQASQLAEFLSQKQQDLDQRESTINATMSQLDKERRLLRIQLNEQELLTAQREEAYRSQLAAIEARLADISSAETAIAYDQSEAEKQLSERIAEVERNQQACELRMGDLDRRSADLDERRREFQRTVDESYQELDRQRKQLLADRAAHDIEYAELLKNFDGQRRVFDDLCREQVQQTSQDREANYAKVLAELHEERTQFRNRLQQMETLDTLLRDNLAACDRERRELDARRSKLDEQSVEQLRALAVERQRMEESVSVADQQIRQREELLSKRSAAVEQLRADLMRVHQDTLEMRIVLEQLWSQISDRIGAAEAARSIATGKARLADEYRLASQAMAEQQREVQELGRRLTEQQSKLRRQRTEVQEWLARRNQELHERETRIAVREERLSKCDRIVADLHKQIEDERRNSFKRLCELGSEFGLKLRAEERSR